MENPSRSDEWTRRRVAESEQCDEERGIKASQTSGWTTPPLQFVKLVISSLATAWWDLVIWCGEETHDDNVAMMHTDICLGHFHMPSREEKYVVSPSETSEIRVAPSVTLWYGRCSGKLERCM